MEIVLDLSTDNINALCRTCMNYLQEATAQNYLFVENTATVLASQFTNLTSLKILPDDKLPNVICNQCKEDLSFVSEFKERCLKVNDTLCELISGQRLSNVKIEEEDPLAIFSSNELTCASESSLTKLHCASQIQQSSALIDTEVNKVANELTYSNFSVTDPDSSNKNETSIILEKPIVKCSDISEETMCKICSRQYTNKLEHLLHFLKHAMIEQNSYEVGENCFFCEFCGEVFHDKSDLKLHYHHFHNIQDEQQWKCLCCEETFNDDVSALRHERSENHFESVTAENGTFKCLLCSEQCMNVSTLLMHSVLHLISKYDCKDCKKQFISQLSLQNHLENHADFILTCNICNEFFTNKYVLNKHLSSAHIIQINDNSEANNSNDSNNYAELSEQTIASDLTGNVHESPAIKTYNCATCGADFLSSVTLKKHMLSHKRQKNYSCTICAETFRWKYYLDRHIISKHKQIRKSDEPNETHKCMHPNCNMSFTTSDDLANHVRAHPSRNAFKCETCGRKFSEVGNLRRHLLVHTGIKPFTCQVCDRKFRLKQHVRLHMINMHKSVADKLNLHSKMMKCETCKKEFKKYSSFKAHLLLHNTPKLFSCLVCNKKFRSKSNLTLHVSCKHKTLESDKLDKTETTEKPYKCTFPNCNKSFTATTELTNHVRLHLDLSIDPYECIFCKRRFSLTGNLKRHMRVHTGERPFPCKVCGKRLSSNQHLQIHMTNLHAEVTKAETVDKAQDKEKLETYECETCKKSFSDSGNLKTHLLIHTEQRPFSCNMCDKKFELEYHLKWHVIYKHQEVTDECNKTETVNEAETEEKVYKCTFPNCNESFNISTHLTDHVRVHLPLKIKPYECATCGKTFTEFGNLKRHVLVHTDEMPFACEICNKKFRLKQNLKRHIVRHKAESEKQGEKQHADETETSDKRYKCTFPGCNESFNTPSHLTNHGRIHLPMKIQPYECETCGRKFSEFGNLRRHLHVHTDEMPFTCHVCSRKFRLKQNLKLHIARHNIVLQRDGLDKTQTIDESKTSEKVYKCSYPSCGESFNCSTDLTNHVRVHQPLKVKPYECGTCGREFAVFSNLKRHLRVHTDEMPFTCHVCNKKFRLKQNLKLHIARHKTVLQRDGLDKTQTVGESKTPEKVYKCSYPGCGESVNCSTDLTNHIRIHQPLKVKPYECGTCGREFAVFSNLKRHMLVHSDEKHFLCHICSRKFRFHQNLKRHIALHHKTVSESGEQGNTQCADEESSDSVPILQPLDGKDLECDTYSKKFTEFSNLKRPTCEKHFVCYMCNKTFRLKQHLKKHLLTHPS